MSVSSVNQYTYGMTLADLYYQTAQNESPGSLLSGSASATSHAGLSAYGAMQSGEGVAAIKKAVSEIQADGNGRVTFKMIQEYCAELEKNFEQGMRAAASLAGVPEDLEFRLVANSKGEIEVLCDDAGAKALIEAVLAEIPALEEEFKYIQALKNAGKAQSSSAAAAHRLSLQATKAGLQQEAMETFLTDLFSGGSLGYSSLLAEFDGDSASYFLGANYLV